MQNYFTNQHGSDRSRPSPLGGRYVPRTGFLFAAQSADRRDIFGMV
jgi:hypothetical protein